MPIFRRLATFRCGGGAHYLFCLPVTVNIETGLVVKVFISDIIVLVAFDVIERGVREMIQQTAGLLDQLPLRV